MNKQIVLITDVITLYALGVPTGEPATVKFEPITENQARELLKDPGTIMSFVVQGTRDLIAKKFPHLNPRTMRHIGPMSKNDAVLFVEEEFGRAGGLSYSLVTVELNGLQVDCLQQGSSRTYYSPCERQSYCG